MRPMSISPLAIASRTAMLFVKTFVSLATMSSSHFFATSSPSSLRMAVTNDSNDGLVGAQPTRPFHSSFGTSSALCGRSPGFSSRLS